jgi:GTP-binding protein HflX
VSGDRPSSRHRVSAHLEELTALVVTAGGIVAGKVIQRSRAIHPATFLSRGKLEEVKGEVEKTDADFVAFDDDLSPAQSRNLEKRLRIKILDRSELILDIFSRHARTREAMTQVELAQLQYLLPRLSGMWQHLSRLGGGIGTRGPGETQLEVDRRQVRRKISILRKHLRAIERERDTQTRRRKQCFRVCLVGYTNAGKSTLFNSLTQAGVLVEDKLFATLETTTRKLYLDTGPVTLLSDTVGFITKLPHHLVASFRATLREVQEADLLLHVADASHSELEEQMAAVRKVLDDLLTRPVPQILVLNKADLVDEVRERVLRLHYPDALLTSSLSQEDVEKARERIGEEVRSLRRPVRISYAYRDQERLRKILDRGQRVAQQYLPDLVVEELWMAEEDVSHLMGEGFRVQFVDGLGESAPVTDDTPSMVSGPDAAEAS